MWLRPGGEEGRGGRTRGQDPEWAHSEGHPKEFRFELTGRALRRDMKGLCSSKTRLRAGCIRAQQGVPLR